MANVMYFLVAVFGLTLIMNISIEAFYLLKWIGAGYLTWIGANIIWKSFSQNRVKLTRASPIKALAQGFLTQAANQNLILYFTAILPLFIDPSADTSSQIFILGASSLLVEAIVLLLYSYAGRFVYDTGSPKARNWINRVGGGMLIGAALMLGSVQHEAD